MARPPYQRFPTERASQRWIFDRLLGIGGYDVLHPEVTGFFIQLGYGYRDEKRVFNRKVRSADNITQAWADVAMEVDRQARRAETEGMTATAAQFYHRAMLLWGRARYSVFQNNERKLKLHQQLERCFQKFQQYAVSPVERIEAPYDDSRAYGLFFPNATGRKAPLILLIPGMDMFKEDWAKFSFWLANQFGWNALAIDGPGQGETVLKGGFVTVDNYERAASALIDQVANRPEVDADRIVLFGVSMGSYWGSRVAASDRRIKAAATALSCYGPKDVIFNVAQPNFKINFMYMANIKDEAEFDRFADQLVLDDVAPKLNIPVLMIHGEIDELTPMADVETYFDQLDVPVKDLWVWEDEFHPMGGVAQEVLTIVADWLNARLEGLPTPASRKRFIRADGTIVEGSATRPLVPAEAEAVV